MVVWSAACNSGDPASIEQSTGHDVEIGSAEETGPMDGSDDGESDIASPPDTGAQEPADEASVEEPPLPPSLSSSFAQQLAAFNARREACGAAPVAALSDGLPEHLTTRLEYEHHLECLGNIEASGCADISASSLVEVEDCLYAEPTVYDALEPAPECPYAVDEFTFDHRRRRFSLHNAYWLLWMAKACNLVEPAAIRAQFASRGFDEVEVLVKNRLTVAVLEADEYIVFAFKGSTGTSDYLSNAAYIMDDTWKTNLPGKVHSGFFGTLDSGWPKLKAELLAARDSGKTIIFTGHSLGGACSQMAAMKAHKMGVDVAQIYNFATPRVGNKVFVDAFEERFGDRFYRVNNGLDMAPHVPPSAKAEQAAKDAILGLIGDADDPGLLLGAISAILDFGLEFAAYTHAGDEYMFDKDGYFQALRPYDDTDEIPYWENLPELFEGEDIFEIFSELGVLPEYHSDGLQLCYQARAVHQLLYER